jgi:hypothetical protein
MTKLEEFISTNEADISQKNPTWSKERVHVAAEQLFYQYEGISSGKIDGLVGPQTLHAREVYKGRLVKDSTPETWRDNLPEPHSTHSKWPKQNEAAMNSFFGSVGTNQVECTIPYKMVIAWEPTKTLTSFTCHKLVKSNIQNIFEQTLNHYGYDEIKRLGLHLFGGCLNVRKMRGGSAWSIHSWGCAVDLDPDRNQLKWGKDKAAFAKPEYDKFWEFVYAEGAISLGKERNFDFMHFQFANL